MGKHSKNSKDKKNKLQQTIRIDNTDDLKRIKSKKRKINNQNILDDKLSPPRSKRIKKKTSKLKQLLIKTAGLLPNQKNKMFLGFDLEKIKTGINKKYDLPKTKKTAESFYGLLTMDIKKSLLNIPFLNKKKKISEKNKNLNNIPKKIGEEEDTELSNEEIENNFYVQATKESFDDLLLGTEDNDFDEIKMLSNEEEESDKEKKMDFFGQNSTHKKKEKAKTISKII